MAIISPLTFFRFAAEHSELLERLYEKRSRISETELREYVLACRKETDPAPQRIINQLEELGILEPSPEATAAYEMRRPVAQLLAYLLHEYRLTSVEVIQAYLTDLQKLGGGLLKAVADKDGAGAVRLLADAADEVERMRQDSRHSREAIVADVVKLKANKAGLTVKERLGRVEYLWTRYMAPLRDMLDVRKEMERQLDSLEAALARGEDAFETDPAVHREFAALRSRALRLRREIAADFKESIKELLPLHNELHRESAVSRGAAHALQLFKRGGLSALGLTKRLGISSWRTNGLFADEAVGAYMLGLKGYAPKLPPPLTAARPPDLSALISAEEFSAKARAAVPLEDTLDWLITQYPRAAPEQLLRCYARLYYGEFGAPRFSEGPEKTYAAQDCAFSAVPMGVEKNGN
ncbi:MAG: hypothetical protein NTY45_04315 [Elusimicrobia bacterium]|nr:hypothetical protein [Elusimicrobiota bacterium]